MNFSLIKYPTLYLSIISCLCFNSCDNNDGDGSNVTPEEGPLFEPGFNPETLQIHSQVWMINNDNDSNFVCSIISASVMDYDYTTHGQRVSSKEVPYTYSSLGKSASLTSTFNFTGNQDIYDTLTTELSNESSPLSLALVAFDSNDESTAADVIKAANDAVPNLILFFDGGKFYTLDSIELTTNNDDQGTQTLVGSPIIFTDNIASEGNTSIKTQVSTVVVSYRTPISGS